MHIQSGQVIFHMIGEHADSVFLSPSADCREITSIHVPLSVTSHKSWDFYWFPNLLEIVAHPDSPKYVTAKTSILSQIKRKRFIFPQPRNTSPKMFSPRIFMRSWSKREIRILNWLTAC